MVTHSLILPVIVLLAEPFAAPASPAMLADTAWVIPAPDGFADVFPDAVGDVDGDGHADLMLTSTEGQLALLPGTAEGPAASPSWTLELGPPLVGVTALGDLDGDGFDDVLVASPLESVTESYEGVARLFRGSAEGLEGTPSWTFAGGRPAKQGGGMLGFGGSVASGDYDGDGDIDVAIAAPGYANVGGSTGAVFVFEGGPMGLSAEPVITLTPDDANGYFDDIVTVHDRDGDGADELSIAIWGFDGWTVSIRGSGTLASLAEPGLTISFVGAETGGNSLESFAQASGDVDADGTPEVFGPWQQQVPHVALFSTQGGAASEEPTWSMPDPEVVVEDGVTVGALDFARSLAIADIDQDGYDDLIFSRASTGDRGILYVVPGTSQGPTPGPSEVLVSEGSGFFGSHLAVLGDIDGDGALEVASEWLRPSGPYVVVYAGGLEPPCAQDDDLDAVCNDIDNCSDAFNPLQADIDKDGIGDVCEEGGDDGGDPSSTGADTGSDATGATGDSTSGGETTHANETEDSQDSSAETEATAGLSPQIAETGCDCRSGGSPSGGWLLLLTLVGLRRRRKAAACALALSSGCQTAPRSLDPAQSESTETTEMVSESEAEADASTGAESSSSGDDGDDRCCSADGASIVECTSGEVVRDCPDQEACNPQTLLCVDGCSLAEESENSVGCTYYATPMSIAAETQDEYCFAVIVSNPWFSTAHLEVEYGGETLDLAASMVAVREPSGDDMGLDPVDPADGIAPGASVALLLTGPRCEALSVEGPPLRAARAGALSRDAGRGQGFRVVSDVPVVAHQVNPFLGADSYVTGSSLLFPTPTWGDNYVVLSPAAPLEVSAEFGGYYEPTLNLVAAEDGTEVTILSTAELDGGVTLPTFSPDDATTFELDAGEHAQFRGAGDFTGTVIDASGPLGVWVGHECAYFPEDVQACDHLEQMLPSIRTSASKYVGAGVKRTTEAVAWRLFATVDGTELNWSTDVGGPTSLDRGESAFVLTGTPFTVSSQDEDHPFYLFNYMTGQEALGIGPDESGGDPEFVLAPAPDQFLDRYTFFVDPTYTTQLVLVRGRGDSGSDGAVGGFSDVELGCGGDDLVTVSQWRDIGDDGDYQFARVSPDCAGQMSARSDAPFGLHVWGLSSYASVGYPAGLGLRVLNGLSIPPVP